MSALTFLFGWLGESSPRLDSFQARRVERGCATLENMAERNE